MKVLDGILAIVLIVVGIIGAAFVEALIPSAIIHFAAGARFWTIEFWWTAVSAIIAAIVFIGAILLVAGTKRS